MGLYKEGAKKITGLFGNVNGEKKKIASLWGNKDEVPIKVWSGKTKRFVAVGQYCAYYSLDGKTWLPFDEVPSKKINDVCYGEDRFIAVGMGTNCYINSDENPYVLTTESNFSDGKNRTAVCYGNGYFFSAVSTAYFYRSKDLGVTWETIDLSSLSGGTSKIINDMCYGNDRFIAVGNDGFSCYSLDGENWVAMNGISDTSSELNSVCYGNGKFICVSSTGDIYYSLDGETWFEGTIDISPGTGSFGGVCYGNGKFVAVNSRISRIYTSNDGINWTKNETVLLEYATKVCYGNGRYVAVGTNGGTFYSLDGENWVANSAITSYDFYSVCFSK